MLCHQRQCKLEPKFAVAQPIARAQRVMHQTLGRCRFVGGAGDLGHQGDGRNAVGILSQVPADKPEPRPLWLLVSTVDVRRLSRSSVDITGSSGGW